MALSIPQRPLSDQFRLAYAWDPAFDCPPADCDEDTEKAYLARYEHACEALDYASIAHDGHEPTWFWFRPVRDSELRALHALNLDGLTLSWVVFRLTLQKIENGGVEAIERAVDRDYPQFGKIVTRQLCEGLGAVSMELGRVRGEIVTRLGSLVWARSAVPSPKS